MRVATPIECVPSQKSMLPAQCNFFSLEVDLDFNCQKGAVWGRSSVSSATLSPPNFLPDSDSMDWKEEAFRSRIGEDRSEREGRRGGGKMEPNLASDVAQKATKSQGLEESAPQIYTSARNPISDRLLP